jgi:signal transduction histidine kinase/ActR/RegA family two-component response regulator
MKRIVQRLYNAMRPASGPVLVEQLKLVSGHQVTGVVPAALVTVLLWWMLSDQANFVALSVWAALMVSGLRVSYLHARANLRHGITPERAPVVVRRLVLERIFYSTGWGGLGFLTLGSVTTNYSLLVLAAIAGMTSTAMSAFAPVLLLFAVTVIPTISLITLKVGMLGDLSFYALGITFILYMLVLLGQAFHSSRQVRAAIDLRFENVELLNQLHAETQIAETAQRAAEHANAAKSMFLAAASHDLRQPIHAQGLFLDVLSRTELDPQQRELLNSAMAARESSSDMLNTLLDFSRVEAGVIEPQIQAFYVQPMLNKIEREFSQQADSKGLAYRSRETALAVHSDPQLIELILRNLVSNAIKYTRHGGLLVNFRRKGVLGVFEVWDTGIGIAVSQQEAIFREFHQLGNPERDRNKGLGLGLAIVQGLAHSLGIRLSLNSVVGRGSVFRLELPLAMDETPQATNFVPHREHVLPNVRVLVLDDDPVICAGMVQLLHGWGCVCEAAQSIEMAIALAPNFQPDVVISDYRLREHRTGIEAVCALRKVLGVALPALLITGDTAPERLREAVASGIPVLHKPVSSSQLFHALISVLPEAMSQ